MRTPIRIMLAALVITVPFLSGCNDGGPSTKTFVKHGTGQRLRVAVLPFDNVSKDQDAGRVITNTVITYLLSTGSFDVVEPGVVYGAMASENIRNTEGITVETCQKLQPKLNADAYIVGMVEEYGEVRIGPDTYPSISFSARLVNAQTADILWAATISKTGADNVKVFDIGRVSSLGKLSKRAVAAMAVSLNNSRKNLSGDMAYTAAQMPPADRNPGSTMVAAVPAPPAPPVPAPAPAPAPTEASPAPAPAVPAAATTPEATSTDSGAKPADEAAPISEKDLTALLTNIGTAKISDTAFKKHFHDTVEGTYRLGSTGKSVEVKLVDYRAASTAQKFLQGYNPDAKPTTFEAVPAFTGESGFGYYHLDLAIGRFGVFLRGAKGNQADIEAIGKGLVGQLK